MYKSDKGQVSLEFIIILTLIMGTFLFLFISVNNRRTELLSINRMLSAREIADETAWNINEAYLAGYGSKKSFYVPSTLSDTTNFTLLVLPSGRLVEIRWSGRQYQSPLITSNISGNLTLSQGRVNITNGEGTIEIEQ